MPNNKTLQEEACEAMLDVLDEIRQQVERDELFGFSCVMAKSDGNVRSVRAGDIDDPLFVLVEEDIASTHRQELLTTEDLCPDCAAARESDHASSEE